MIVDGAFLVAGCDAALLLEAVDQALDAVALAINGPIKAGVAALIVFCRDDRGDAPAPDPAARGLTGIGFVARHLERAQPRPAPSRAADRPLIEQPLQGGLLVALAAGQHGGERFAPAFGTQVQLGRKASLRAPQRLVLTPRRRRCGVRRRRVDGRARWWHPQSAGSSPPRCAPRLRLQRRQYPVPYTRRAPAVEPARYRPDRAITLGQVAPRRTGAQDPQNAVQDGAVGVARPARARPLGRQQRLQPPPLLVRQIIASHPVYMAAYMAAGLYTETPLQTRPREQPRCTNLYLSRPLLQWVVWQRRLVIGERAPRPR